MEKMIRPGEFYRHFKNKLYQIVTVAVHSETGERLVVYQALYGDYQVYARPYDMFTSQVDHEKYPDVKQKYRFERVDPMEPGMGFCAPYDTEKPVAGTVPDIQTPEAGTDQEQFCSGTKEEPLCSQSAMDPEKSPGEDVGEKAGDATSALMDFLDSDSYEAQITSLKRMRATATQKELDSIYIVLDMKPVEGSISEQLRGIAGFLKMQHHFDGGHLR